MLTQGIFIGKGKEILSGREGGGGGGGYARATNSPPPLHTCMLICYRYCLERLHYK